jgi:hypothetical protein
MHALRDRLMVAARTEGSAAFRQSEPLERDVRHIAMDVAKLDFIESRSVCEGICGAVP